MTRIRMRTGHRAGKLPGQPVTVTTNPEKFPQKKPQKKHYCGECFGPRNNYEKRLFCNACMENMWTMGSWGYDSFIRSCRAVNARFMKQVLEGKLCGQEAAQEGAGSREAT